MAPRLSYTTRRLLALLHVRGSEGVSYDELAATLGCDRSTARIAVRRLEVYGRIKVTRSGGRAPNRYTPV